MSEALLAIWRKIMRGERLTYAEETLWRNRWNTDVPRKVI
jgi:hypothetical protein